MTQNFVTDVDVLLEYNAQSSDVSLWPDRPSTSCENVRQFAGVFYLQLTVVNL